ncbi:MAG: hypothetical protein WA919_27185 [Coleofasciculaceae cyanobacterium]
MYTQFRTRYPLGGLVTELLAIEHGQYIVRCLVQVEGATLATGLAAAKTVELAEDQARSRAIAVLGFETANFATQKETNPAMDNLPVPKKSRLNSSTKSSSKSKPASSAPLLPEIPQEIPPESVDESFSSLDESILEDTKPIEENNTPVLADQPNSTDNHDSSPVEIPEEEETLLSMPEDSSLSQEPTPSSLPSDSPPDSLDTETTSKPTDDELVDFSDIIARTNVELRRLGWNNQQGREYLLQTYGKRSRQLLTDEELLDFLQHLEAEPNPE